MTFSQKIKDNKAYLLVASIIAFVLSGLVFVFFITGNSGSNELAKADFYGSDQVVIKINQERKKRGLNPLIVNEKLQQAAANKAEDMVKNNYFSHISPVDGVKWSDFIKNTGYIYLEAGENLANGYENIDEMVGAWMSSPTHRENILSTGYFETGVAYKKGFLNEKETVFVVQVFGRTTSNPVIKIDYYEKNQAEHEPGFEEGSLIKIWQSE